MQALLLKQVIANKRLNVCGHTHLHTIQEVQRNTLTCNTRSSKERKGSETGPSFKENHMKVLF